MNILILVFYREIVEVIEEAGYQYVVKAKEYSKQSEEVCSGQGIKTGRRQKTTKPFRK